MGGRVSLLQPAKNFLYLSFMPWLGGVADLVVGLSVVHVMEERLG